MVGFVDNRGSNMEEKSAGETRNLLFPLLCAEMTRPEAE